MNKEFKILIYLIFIMNIICLILMINKITDNKNRINKLEENFTKFKAEMIIKTNYLEK